MARILILSPCSSLGLREGVLGSLGLVSNVRLSVTELILISLPLGLAIPAEAGSGTSMIDRLVAHPPRRIAPTTIANTHNPDFDLILASLD
jgi:hypothetical protein